MDCMALYKWIQWLYFHGLGGSATMEYSHTKYYSVLPLANPVLPLANPVLPLANPALPLANLVPPSQILFMSVRSGCNIISNPF